MRIARAKKHRSVTWAIAGLVILVVAAGGVVGYNYFFQKPAPPYGVPTVNYDPPTDEQKQQQEQQKDESIKQQDQKKEDTPPVTTALTVTISRASQAADGQPLNIRAVVTGVTTGTCTATLAMDGQATITKTSAVTQQATYNSCAAIDVPVTEFGASGDWVLSVSVSDGTHQSQPAKQTIRVNK